MIRDQNEDDLIPPEELVEKLNIGGGSFKEIGEGIIHGLNYRGFLDPDFKILDIGCGLGRLARPLTTYLSAKGEFHGVDITEESIAWCQSSYSKYENFHFDWINTYSKFYNPEGVMKASEYKFPFQDNYFDFVILTSVFTHMFIPDVRNYLSEISRMLKPGKTCFSTYFLITSQLMDEHPTMFDTHFPIEGGMVGDKESPEAVVFLEEDLIRAMYPKSNLEITMIKFGTWPSRNISAAYQDEIFAVKRG